MRDQHPRQNDKAKEQEWLSVTVFTNASDKRLVPFESSNSVVELGCDILSFHSTFMIVTARDINFSIVNHVDTHNVSVFS